MSDRLVVLPEGWTLVPAEPTAAMLGAAQTAWINDPLRRTTTLWSAMLAAAPAAPAVQGEPVAWQRVDRPERIVTKLSRRSVAEIDSGVEFIPLYTAPQPAEQRQRPPAVDDFVATFRCESNGVVGTTTAKIHSVSRHDDGVIEVVIDHWPQQAVEGEEIMVNTPYDVFILPLRPSGWDGKGPRFVVHVPGPEQTAPQAQSSTEAWRDLAIAGAAIVEEIREIVGLKGKPGDVVEALRGQLAESRSNDRTAMDYLAEVRAIVGGEDFPAMVRNVQELREAAQPDASVLSILREARESVHYHKGMQHLGHEAGQRHAARLATLLERIDAALAGKGGAQ